MLGIKQLNVKTSDTIACVLNVLFKLIQQGFTTNTKQTVYLVTERKYTKKEMFLSEKKSYLSIEQVGKNKTWF